MPSTSPSPPPPDGPALVRWLEAREEEIAVEARRVLRRAVSSAFRRYTGMTAAAGDPAAFDEVPSDWARWLDERFAPLLSEITLASAAAAFNAAPNVPPPAVPAWTQVVNQNAIDYVSTASNRLRGVGDDVWNRVRQVATESLNAGITGDPLARALRDVTDWSEERADTVARTETLGAYANGTHAGNDALGPNGPVEHVWNAVGDARTRPTHLEADGQTRKWGEPFMVGGESMLYPHAPGSSAGNVVNCRCVEDVLYRGDTRPDGSTVGDDPADTPQAATARVGMGDDLPMPSTSRTHLDSWTSHVDPATGRFTPERQALHDDIVRTQLDGLPAQENPEMLFMGGGGGAGKSTSIKAGHIDEPPDGVTVNADVYKEMLPEVRAMQQAGDASWAAFAHEESSYIAKRVQAAAIERRVNVTMDAVGADPAKVARQIEQARQAGYGTRAAYVSIDPVDGLRRAAKRAEDAARRGEPARVINPAVVLKAHLDANAAFEQVARMVQSAVLIDNQGAVPRTLARVVRGDTTIVDADGWETFLARRRDQWVAHRQAQSITPDDDPLLALLSAVQSGPVEYLLTDEEMAAIGRLSMERVQALADLAASSSDRPDALSSDEELVWVACRRAVDAFPGVAWGPVDI